VQASTVRVDQLREGVARTRYSYWSDEEVSAPLRVRIDLSEQTAYFFRGDVKVGQSRVATGTAGHSTPTGSFTISQKVAAKRSTLYGRIYDAGGKVVVHDADTRRHSIPEGGKFVGCPMPYWMRLTGSGVGMHVGPIPNPGSPASHGCVRMPREMARTLFAKASAGTRVTIVH
jgi:lipoprotein-anchoring transpeptidase ErfK/SrfK